MTTTFVVFKKYSSFELAKEVTTILQNKGIEVHFTDNLPRIDGNIMGTSYAIDYEIKIKLSDFEKAEKALSENAENLINQIDKNHYIYSFNDDELYNIILKPDEWNEIDYLMAKKLLEDKGKTVDESMIQSINKQRINDLAKPEENQKAWIYAGYLAAILGGFLGIVIGYVLMTSTKTLPNGEKVYSYSKEDRASGKTIFYLSLVFFPIYLLLKILLTKE